MANRKPGWHFDHRVLDVMVTDPKTGKKLGRPKLRIEIDPWTRMVKSVHIEDPEEAQNGSDESSDQ
jgi:hypothetical protein